MEILIAVLLLAALGLFFGAGLAWAGKKFSVSSDPRLEKIIQMLPGANCGACGMPGCVGFAEGLVQGGFGIERCPVTQADARKQIAKILGIEFEERHRQVAVLRCAGAKSKVRDKFTYWGIKDCVTANMLMSGPKGCVYGCIGLATCVRVCPFGAISMGPDGLPVVAEDKCMACNKCVEACPKGLFSLVPYSSRVVVACRSRDLGKVTKAVCSVGCIACRLCERACKFDAIKVINNVAVIDYQRCTSCGDCVKVCPSHTIFKKDKER